MQNVEAFLILELEVDIVAGNQHVDDIVVVTWQCVMKRRVALHILHNILHLTHPQRHVQGGTRSTRNCGDPQRFCRGDWEFTGRKRRKLRFMTKNKIN